MARTAVKTGGLRQKGRFILKVRRIGPARLGLYVVAALWLLVVIPIAAAAAPYAAMVMDARSGKVLHSRNADTRLHPASLTKMMTLYIAFQAVERGEISMDKLVTISARAAAEPPSKLGLRRGQKIKLRFLVRAAAVKSANDAATAIAEAISGSEAAFARRMNRTAKAMGMTRTTFKNAHGLTESGHMSTARDMTILGRHLLYDFPEYYNLFSRTSTHAGMREVSNTNRRLLSNYQGADGIKTGYTRAAGFNLVASAERGNERIIATVFGGKSTASRNAKVAELLDMGFRRAPSSTQLRKPIKPGVGGTATARVATAPKTSPRPQSRPVPNAPVPVADRAVTADDIQLALLAAQVSTVERPAPVPDATTSPLAQHRPQARPRQNDVQFVSVETDEPEIVTRLSTSGGRHWGVNVGRYPSRYKAQKVLIQTALTEMASLDGTLRKVVKTPRGFDANFLGMTREGADYACRRLTARNISCKPLGPGT